MIKPSSTFKMINPIYALLSGVLGGAIPYFMYMRNFPVSMQPIGLQFTQAVSFFTWVFLISVLFSGISVIAIPSWKVCHDLFSSVVKSGHKPWKVIGVLITSTIMYVLALLALFSMAERVLTLPPSDFINELNDRFNVVYLYSALGFLPVMFSIILISYLAGILSADIPFVNSDEKRTVEFIEKYLYYRNILQICLVTSGTILSLNPIITAAFASIWKEIEAFTDETFPSQAIIIYGLIFTLMLILIYVPTY